VLDPVLNAEVRKAHEGHQEGDEQDRVARRLWVNDADLDVRNGTRSFP
jgi:hypothetical protein